MTPEPSTAPPTSVEAQLRAQVAELEARATAAETRLLEQDNAINWFTSCTSCARTLDSAYAEYVRAEAAEKQVAKYRERLARLRGLAPPGWWPAWEGIAYERAVDDVIRRVGDLDVEPPPEIPYDVRVVSAALAAYRAQVGLPQRDYRPIGRSERGMSAALEAARKVGECTDAAG